MKYNLSIVVPVYRSGARLEELHRRITAAVAPVSTHLELVLVDDSDDASSWPVITRLAARDERVKGIRLARNYGQQSASLCGIRAARGDVIVTLDDDLQNPPESIPSLLSALQEGCVLVYGTPLAGQHGWLRNLASRLFKRLLGGLARSRMPRQFSAFRAFRASLREAFADSQGPMLSIDVLLSWGTTNIQSVPVPMHQRAAGRSGYRLGNLLTLSVNILAGYSTAPLRVASVLGFGFALFGLLVLAYVLGRYLLSGSSVPGFPFLASVIAIFSGVQLFAIGIIGEYLARMYLHSLARPPYVVAERTDGA